MAPSLFVLLCSATFLGSTCMSRLPHRALFAECKIMHKLAFPTCPENLVLRQAAVQKSWIFGAFFIAFYEHLPFAIPFLELQSLVVQPKIKHSRNPKSRKPPRPSVTAPPSAHGQLKRPQLLLPWHTCSSHSQNLHLAILAASKGTKLKGVS